METDSKTNCKYEESKTEVSKTISTISKTQIRFDIEPTCAGVARCVDMYL